MVKRMAFWGRDRFVGKCLDYDRSGRLIKEYPVDGMLFLPVHPLEDPRHGVK